jgi:hypothetical protein
MRVGLQPRAALAVLLLAVAVAGGACGGGTSETHSAGRGGEASSGQAPGGASQRGGRDARPAWPHAKVLDRVAGETIRVDDRRVRVDPATVTCGGDGRGSRRGSERVWTRFTCIQPTFGRDGVTGPDVVFRVEPTGRRSFRITGQNLTRY